MTQFYFFLPLIFLWASLAMGQSTPEWSVTTPDGIQVEVFKDFKDFEGIPGLEVKMSDHLGKREKVWFPITPKGTNNYPTTEDCSHEALESAILRGTTVNQQATAAQAWVNHCQNQISDVLLRDSYTPLINYARVEYPFEQNKYIRLVKAKLPDGRMLAGFLAVHDNQTRPLVIAKCGMYCDAKQGVAHRSALMHLFDESPFNVLTLANISGFDFQKENQAISVGGFDEGRQVYQIVKALRAENSPLKSCISSVHVLGVSLGGHAALYTSLYASLNDPANQRSIQSVIAACPVVNLDKSIRRLYSTDPVSALATFETLQHINNLLNFLPLLNRFFDGRVSWRDRGRLYDGMSRAILDYYQMWTKKQAWDLLPFVGLQINDLQQFWELNDFTRFIDDVEVPTLLIAADNDELVKPGDNSKPLKEKLDKSPHTNIDAVFFQQGNHCAFAMANGWANYSGLLRSYVLSHSPEAAAHWRERTYEVTSLPRDYKVWRGEQIVETVWTAEEGNSELTLALKIFTFKGSGRDDCFADNILRNKPACYRELKLRLPIKNLPLDRKETPQNAYEVSSLTRLANTRLKVIFENNQPRFIKGWVWENP